MIAGAIRPEHNVGCVVYCSTEIIEPGVIRHIEGTRFTIGEPDGSDSSAAGDLGRVRRGRPASAPVESRLREQIWLKLVGNVAFNPITALTGATLGQLGDLPEMRELLRAVFAECAAVADRLAIRSRSRWTGGSRPGWRSATTRPRCCRISKRASGSSWTA